MFPKGFHPIFCDLDTNGRPAHPIHRSKTRGVKYYFTDFGISNRFREGELRLVLGKSGLDQAVPELSNVHGYDPFKADIFILGNVLRRNFVLVRANLLSTLLLVADFTRPMKEICQLTIHCASGQSNDARRSFKASVCF